MTSHLAGLWGPTVPDRWVKFRDPRLNHSGEIRPKAVGCCIFSRFSNFYKCRPEVAGDVISGVALEHVGMDVHAKCGESMLISGRIIRLFGRADPLYALLCSN